MDKHLKPMEIKVDSKHYQFCLFIINQLHLDPNRFFKDVVDRKDYESLLYSWINLLFAYNISVKESIRFIYKARHLALFHNTFIAPTIYKPQNDNITLNNEVPLHYYQDKETTISKAS